MEILSYCGLSATKPAAFLMEQRHYLSDSATPVLADPERYRRLVGRLLYLTITRPELCYSVHTLAQFMHEPHAHHWDAAIWVLRYLKHSPGQGILLRTPESLQLVAFCDSDWASCPSTHRLTTGYFVMLRGCPISWKTKK